MKTFLLSIFAGLLALPAFAMPSVGEPAPAFTATTASGEQVSLADYAGKTVVLEWTNHGCPFVKKFYEQGDMQRFQQQASKDDVVWLRVISSAEGKQGYLSAEEATALAEEQKVAATATILDPEGTLGKQYGAKTTPHMYVINPEGTLVYMGAIDDTPSVNQADIEGASNYVMAALEAVKNGAMPEPGETKPYGCSVKY